MVSPSLMRHVKLLVLLLGVIDSNQWWQRVQRDDFAVGVGEMTAKSVGKVAVHVVAVVAVAVLVAC